jgi:5-formyltetrahydrofolate cyclo-ligase
MDDLSKDNLRQVEAKKAEIREKCRILRAAIKAPEKERMDALIFENLVSLPEFSACSLLLTYVSVGDEPDTRAIIDFALKSGRAVAVPRCLTGRDELEFYIIDKLDSLKCGKSGLYEPEPDAYKRIEKTAGGLCLLPGLCFDKNGGRLGYGRGYYDRFLDGFCGVAAGLCLSPLLSGENLPCGPFDRPVELIVTDKGIIRTGALKNLIN